MVNVNDWISIRVRADWPATWELPHCGTCGAPWWTITLAPRASEYRLWKLHRRAAHDATTPISRFASIDAVTAWLNKHYADPFCLDQPACTHGRSWEQRS